MLRQKPTSDLKQRKAIHSQKWNIGSNVMYFAMCGRDNRLFYDIRIAIIMLRARPNLSLALTWNTHSCQSCYLRSIIWLERFQDRWHEAEMFGRDMRSCWRRKDRSNQIDRYVAATFHATRPVSRQVEKWMRRLSSHSVWDSARLKLVRLQRAYAWTHLFRKITISWVITTKFPSMKSSKT